MVHCTGCGAIRWPFGVLISVFCPCANLLCAIHSDSKLLAMLPFIEDVSQLSKVDSKLEKLCTLSVSMSFNGLKQQPTLATLKQYVSQILPPHTV